MGHSMNARRAHAEVTDGEPRLSGLIGAVRKTHATLTPLEGGEWFLACVERAIDAVGQKKVAALTMGVDRGLLTNQLKGEGHLSARRLGLMDQPFWEALIDELRVHFGMDNDAERLDRAIEGATRCLQQIGAIARKGMK
jgi:hypothetical protein